MTVALARIVMACVAPLAWAAGCSSSDEEMLPPIWGTADGLFPAATLTDWVSYVARLSQVSVVSEEEIPPPRDVLERREGYIGRKVLVRIENDIWLSSGHSTAPPMETKITVAGWVLQGDRRHRFILRDSPRIETGGRYVLPLVSAPRNGEDQWGPLSTGSVFEVPGDHVATADVHATGNSPVARSLSVMSRAEIQRTLDGTPPDPLAQKYWHLPPFERLKAVQAEKP
jgi:hypothetical protein